MAFAIADNSWRDVPVEMFGHAVRAKVKLTSELLYNGEKVKGFYVRYEGSRVLNALTGGETREIKIAGRACIVRPIASRVSVVAFEESSQMLELLGSGVFPFTDEEWDEITLGIATKPKPISESSIAVRLDTEAFIKAMTTAIRSALILEDCPATK